MQEIWSLFGLFVSVLIFDNWLTHMQTTELTDRQTCKRNDWLTDQLTDCLTNQLSTKLNNWLPDELSISTYRTKTLPLYILPSQLNPIAILITNILKIIFNFMFQQFSSWTLFNFLLPSSELQVQPIMNLELL